MTKKLKRLQTAHRCARSAVKCVEAIGTIGQMAVDALSTCLRRTVEHRIADRLNRQAREEGYVWRWDAQTRRYVLEKSQ